jgi:adenylate kinase family enzyme
VKRVLVIGCGGSGKSTLAREMARKTGLPLIHLDVLYWNPGWVETPPAEWREVVTAAMAGDRWIMDGNYGGTLPLRLEACDTVVFLDVPRLVSLAGILRRRIGTPEKSRIPGCPERLTLEFLMYVWHYRRTRRPRILERLRDLPRDKSVHILTSRREARAFVNGLEPEPDSAA